jgi:L-2-hydroxyglutarate oxidase
MAEADVVVIGGGLVGLATAYALLQSARPPRVRVVEKELTVGAHQSSHNSGVLHAGLYYSPGSLKARLAVEGVRRMVRFCAEHGVPHEVCGKLVVAVDASETGRLETLLDRGRRNGLQGLRWLTPSEAREIEPHVRCVAAVHVPEEGITDYGAVSRVLAAELTRLGAEVTTGAAVTGLIRVHGRWSVTMPTRTIEATVIVNCAGLYADRIAQLAGERPACRIVPFRGEYYRLAPASESLVRHLIYPVPHPAFPFLGVHLSRQIGGGVEAGPNAVLALAREGYARSHVNLADVGEAIAFPGLWRFMARHPGTTFGEVRRSLSRRVFCRSLQRMVPDLMPSDLVPGGAGVRAQAMLPTGELVQDFLLVDGPGAVHVLNAPSPAATASLAIGEQIASRVAAMLAA